MPIKLCIEGRMQLLARSTGGEGGGFGEREYTVFDIDC